MNPGRDFDLVLAGHLGRTVEELLQGSPVHKPIGGAEYGRWKRFYRRQPFGALRGDLQAGVVARAVLTAAGVRPAPSLESFLIVGRRKKRRGKRPPLDLKSWVLMQGGVILDGRQDGNRVAGSQAHGGSQ